MVMTVDEYLDLGEHKDKFHPAAAEQYHKFLGDIRSQVEVDGLAIEDINKYLSDLDRWLFDNGIEALRDWLTKCQLHGSESPSLSCPYAFPFWEASQLKSVITKASRAKQREEEIKAAEIRIANEAFFDKMAELHQKARANEQRKQYLTEQAAAIKKFMKYLAKKKPEFGYPSWLAPYEPHNWFDTSLLHKEKIETWVSPLIQERLPQSLRHFITWDLCWYEQTLPEATYGVLGVPCLTWGYKAVVLAQVDLALKSMEYPKEFCGYHYSLQMEHKKLGCLYVGPASMGSYQDFSTPIALLNLLAQGEMEGPGIQVEERESGFTTFRIQGFEEETVFVHDNFRKLIEDICNGQTLAEALLEKEIIDADTAKLVEAKCGEPLPAAVEPAVCKADPQSVSNKLMEIGWSQADAVKAVEGVPFPKNASVDDIVKVILGES